MLKQAAGLSLMIAALVLAAGSASAVDDGERCRVKKLNATGTYAQDLLRCNARAIGKPPAVAMPCLAAAERKVERAFAAADNRTACPPTLASARAQTAVFVTGVLASAQPTPVPTVAPTPTPTPASTGCGNGVVDAGEQCDGQAFCTAACGFALPTVCCGSAGFCTEGEFPELADVCFLNGIPATLGALCDPLAPGCDPEVGCVGSCVPEHSFAATSICCELPAGCTEQSITTSIQLWSFIFQGCLQAGGTAGLGTCAVSGNCLPGG